jgi:NTP pyrophosphatase (non-canonical NTP hydrolase)
MTKMSNAEREAIAAIAESLMVIPSISLDTARRALEVHERHACSNVGAAGTDNDIRFLALAMAGEAGEAANVVKKSWRDGKPVDRAKLAEEIAGTACYLIGLAAAIKLNLDGEMREQMAAFEARYR